jgi:hypothetical protein
VQAIVTTKGVILQDIDKPRIKLELSLSGTGMRVDVDNPTLINDKFTKQAWDMMNAFIMDMADSLKLEVTDEEFRMMFIEVCYKLIYREMCTLRLLPIWERNFAERLARKKKQEGEEQC